MNEWNDQIVLDKKWNWKVTPHVEPVIIRLIHGIERYTVPSAFVRTFEVKVFAPG